MASIVYGEQSKETFTPSMIYRHEEREKRTKYVGPRPGYPEPSVEHWSTMENYLAARHLSFDAAQGNGWYPAYYKGAPRIVIPCSNSAGVPYFQARDMSGRQKLRYASPAASRDDSLVVVWPDDRAKGSVVVEGPMDALAAAGLGYLGVALMGNQPNAAVLERLAALVRSFQPVTVLPDLDMLEFGPVVFCALVQMGIDGSIRLLPKKDLAEMSPKERRRFL